MKKKKRNRYCLTIKSDYFDIFSSQLLTVRIHHQRYTYIYEYIYVHIYKYTIWENKINKNEKTTPKIKVTEEHEEKTLLIIILKQ